ncbi:unnamed protein product [Cylicocyclus nassatus]|uniref:C2H2-type domain-containing protein n=1 Tax=Cylicocyclus nassatus TaxID=53992 RepID=A0AA36H722_CYLNA|nr:unnamed protein product [Cylicocyclus nassatus]
MTDSLVEVKKEEAERPSGIQVVKPSNDQFDHSSLDVSLSKDVDSGISSLIDPDEKPLPNCYIIDPGKVISRLSSGPHISKRLLPSDVYNLLRKYSNGHKILLSGTWLVRAFQDSLDFKQQEDALRKFLLVRDGIIKLEDEGGCDKDAQVDESKRQSGFRKHVKVEDPKKEKAATRVEENPVSAVHVKEEPSCFTEANAEDIAKDAALAPTEKNSEEPPAPASSKRKARANSYDCNSCNFAAQTKRKREVDGSSDDTEWTMDNACSNLSRRGRSKSAPSLEQADESDDESFIRPKKDKSCPFCCSVFSTMQSRKRHIMRMHPERANDEAINLHMYRCKPTKELPFACDLCHKIFSNISSLHMHCKSIHEGRRDFVCTVCEKSYPRRCDLRKHMKRVHMKNILSA